MEVAPSASLSLRMSWPITPSESGSSPVNGSSYIISIGSSAIARASATGAPCRRTVSFGIRPCAAQADGIELHHDQIANQLFRQVGMLANLEGDVVENGNVGKQRAELEEHAHAAAHGIEFGVPHPVHRPTVDLDRAAGWPQLAADQAQQRRLAAARPAHDRHHLAAREIHVDSVEDRAVVVGKLRSRILTRLSAGTAVHKI